MPLAHIEIRQMMGRRLATGRTNVGENVRRTDHAYAGFSRRVGSIACWGVVFSCLWLELSGAHVHAQDAGESTELDRNVLDGGTFGGTSEDLTGGVAPPPQAPVGSDWSWRRVFSHARTNGALTAITVDPADPRRVYVGSAEGILYISEDSGVTWREQEMRERLTVARSINLVAPGLPQLGATTPSPLTIFFDAPFQRFLDRIFVTGVELIQFSTLPENIVVGFVPAGVGVPQELLYLAERDRRPELTPIRRIAICPGATYPLQVAGKWELYGSQDNGASFVRLFAIPGVQLLHVACSEADPSTSYLATYFGLFRSSDGGSTFDQMLVGWPGAPTTAVAVAPKSSNGPELEKLFAAWGSGLWAGDPDSEEGLSIVYPDFKNSDTAPWADIRWIEITPEGEIWMATDDGLRVSYDNAETWVAEARSLFERDKVRQVAVGTNNAGERRVAGMLRNWIYATDDRGKTWYPFFNGISERSNGQMATSLDENGNASGWWVVTRGEVWTTIPPAEAPEYPDKERYMRWASDKILQTPALNVVVDEVLERTGLSASAINQLNHLARVSNWAPQLSLQYERDGNVTPREVEIQRGDAQFERITRYNEVNHGYFGQLVWFLDGTRFSHFNVSSAQNQLHGLKHQVQFIAEDSWYERMTMLRRIASGETDAEQSAIFQIRIEAVEAVLEGWMRRSLGSLVTERS